MTKPDDTNLTVTVLGSGTCAPTKARSTSCYHLQIGASSILIDIGFGSMRRMAEAEIDYRTVDYLFITHTHLDHFGDYGPLMMALNYTPGFSRTRPLTVVGPPGIDTFIQQVAQLHGDWIYKNDNFDVSIIELGSEEQLDFPEFGVTAFSMLHSVPVNGYRFKVVQKYICFSGDTGDCPEVVNLMKQADLAVLECSNPDGDPFEYHLTPELAGRIAQKALCKQLLLTHFYPTMEEFDVLGSCGRYFDGKIVLAKDLMTLTL